MQGAAWQRRHPSTPPLAVSVNLSVNQLHHPELVEEAHLYPADATTGERGKATDRIELPTHGLVFPYRHDVEVIGA